MGWTIKCNNISEVCGIESGTEQVLSKHLPNGKHCWSVSFGSAFSRSGVIGPVICINTLVGGMVSEFLFFGAVDYFVLIKEACHI